ncbi:hypothetical protein JMA_28740 [Jeotgalibacillus malaysiensis]|uniref:Uncharacterized protein n=1 Tax=Jeotgalibacillus malaysiensis TaxID=1508404 RepID=A0A0B5AQ11_9BACL|nr:hypothetical protein JMA_28740 [Jeotgalibacillus malaysiensis]
MRVSKFYVHYKRSVRKYNFSQTFSIIYWHYPYLVYYKPISGSEPS